MQRDAGGRGEDLSRVTAADSVRHEKRRWIENVPSDGENAELTLVDVARHVESEKLAVAEERDRRRAVDHVWWRRKIF